ncbi:MAG: M23/M56 family metallopeptidase [Pseudomonadota bacterium]
MTDVGLYLIAQLFAGCVATAAALLACMFDRRLRHWPALWATALAASIAVPVLGWFAPDFSNHFATLGVVSGPLHAYSSPPFWLPGHYAAGPEGGGDSGGSISLHATILTIYLVVAALMLIRLAVGRIRAAMVAARSVRQTSRAGATYWISDEATAPFALAGAGAGRIVIPTRFVATLCSDALEMIIAHEREHLNRHDDLVGLALRIVVALSWFNPASHFLFSRWSLSAEVQCDQAALAGRSPRMRNAYAAMLLKALHIMAGRVRQYPAPSFSTQRLRNEKMRITQVMAGTPATFKHVIPRALLAVGAIGIVGVGGASVAATAGSGGNGSAAGTTIMAASVVAGEVSARFGEVPDPLRAGQTRNHKGIDIKARAGTPVHAPADGTIVEATNLYDGKPAYGIVVVHRSQDGLVTLFAHLDGFVVTPGQTVAKGQKIAMVGNTGRSTGPHVHIETIRDGKHVDPMIAWPELM